MLSERLSDCLDEERQEGQLEAFPLVPIARVQLAYTDKLGNVYFHQAPGMRRGCDASDHVLRD